MRKDLIIGAALVCAAWPGALMAQDGAKLDCVFMGTDTGLRQAIALSMAGGGNASADDQYFDQVNIVAGECIERHAIDPAQKEDYVVYSLARILREWASDELARMNLSTRPIDAAFDFGPGRINPDVSNGVPEAQVAALATAYADDGVDFVSLDQASLEMIGVYGAATSMYWNARGRLAF